jgi:hypothetical protein
MNADGLPEWIPPWWIDHDQRPQINIRIRRIHAHANNTAGASGAEHPTPHEEPR